LYTTGTTGDPKGVVLVQSNKVACGRMIASAWGIRRKWYGSARVQNPYPFFTSTGVSSMMMGWLWTGLTMILEPGFDVLQTLKTIEREKSSVYFAVPAMFRFLLDHPEFKDHDTSSLRSIGYGGSVMPEELIRRLLEAWPGLKIYNVYGLTEAGTGGTYLDAADAVTKLGSIGVPWDSGQEARIVNDEGIDVSANEVGEIILRGPNVMKGYYKDPQATENTVRDGWLYTGDLAYYDEDGYFYYVDRKKDVIVRGGFNVSTIEVEGVLYEHPAVKQCAVVAKPHPKLGEDVLAFVSVYDDKTVNEESLIHFCEDKLANYKRPREIQFLKELPTNPMGKIDKKALRADYLAGRKKE
jgi:acyl-CoA synthetase (AMP-forming)/AMP-acid ligase II